MCESREATPLRLLICSGQVCGDAFLRSVVQRRARLGLAKISLRHFMGAETIVEHPKLEFHMREVGIVKQQALKRADGRFVTRLLSLPANRGTGQPDRASKRAAPTSTTSLPSFLRMVPSCIPVMVHETTW